MERLPNQFHFVLAKYHAVVNSTYTETCNIVDFRFGKNTWPDHEVCNASTAKNIVIISCVIRVSFKREKNTVAPISPSSFGLLKRMINGKVKKLKFK